MIPPLPRDGNNSPDERMAQASEVTHFEQSLLFGNRDDVREKWGVVFAEAPGTSGAYQIVLNP
jgi:hypothetical protein